MTPDEYQKRALALESSEDDTAGVEIPAYFLFKFAEIARQLDIVKRHCFYTKKPDDERLMKNAGEMLALRDLVSRLEGKTFGQIGVNARVLHGIIGKLTEAGELAEWLIRALDERTPDTVNLIEELSDFEWYAALIRDEIGVTQEHVHKVNIAKLEQRYGGGKVHGGERDLEAERRAMEAA